MPILIKLLPYIAAVMLLVGAYTVGHVKGNASCEIKKDETAIAAVQKGDETHAKIQKNVMALPDAALNKRMQQWFRD